MPIWKEIIIKNNCIFIHNQILQLEDNIDYVKNLLENFDTNNNFTSSTFTPTVAGYYQINLNCSMASTTATQFMFINPFKNGSSYVVGNISIPLSGVTYARATVSTLMYLNGTTDYVEGYAYFSANNLTAASSDGVQFSGSLVRTA